MQKSFDVIVVGAGSAGCIVARRLSENLHCRVLLLEAGTDPGPLETPDIRHPYPLSAYDASLQWPGLKGRVVDGPDHRVARIPQGRLVGGSSAINAMVAMRGVAADYDEWHAAGASGWAWEDVEPAFRKLESAQPAGHCDDAGSIAVARQPRSTDRPLSNALLQTWGEAGWQRIEDPNSDFRDGCFIQPMSIDALGRCSANRAYLGEHTRARRNLEVLPGARCLRVKLEGTRVQGVDIEVNGELREVAAPQVFLCAGALQTPAILLRSGVGDAATLQRLGIRIAAPLPAVGRNLQNHGAIPLGVSLRGRTTLPPHLPTAHAALRLSSGEHPSSGDTYFSVWDRAAWHAAGGHIAVLNVVLHRPLSAGSVTLSSADPAQAPVVNFNMLDHPSDVRRLALAVRKALDFLDSASVRAIRDEVGLVKMGRAASWMGMRTPWTRAASGALGSAAWVSPRLLRPLHPLALKPLPLPFLAGVDDAGACAALRSALALQYHQVGTCAMGTSEFDSVTAPNGSVHGVIGLHVADASALPAVPRANTNLPVMMAAERISAMFINRN
ncbi:GMC family oxidoreductase [Ottowia thiooxydans]|uniref:GMC family oxidoreductase n=1 Tax=Ottowia thiooxydans TaxID=219182 RepID=UPI00048B9A08|nr:GMC family oxidoreductase [Ottowia thiooxydans]